MHQQTSIRRERRRSDLSPRQAENIVTRAPVNSTTTARVATSSPSSSVKSTLHSSSTSTASPSSSTLTTFRRTASSRLPHSTMSSAQTVTMSVSASSSSSSFSNISSSRSLVTSSTLSSSTLSTVSISSSIHRLSSSSLVSIFIPRSTTFTTLDHIPQTTLVEVPASSISTSLPSITHSNPSSSSTTSFPAHDFWANKGAVAGTFTAVGLIIIGAVVALAFFFSRSRPGDSKSSESFLQSSTGQLSSGKVTPLDAGRLPASLGLSANDLTTQGPVNSQSNDQVRSVYAPYVPQGLAPVQERGSEAKMSPSNIVSKRSTVKRDSYQPSIDSFYGAPGT